MTVRVETDGFRVVRHAIDRPRSHLPVRLCPPRRDYCNHHRVCLWCSFLNCAAHANATRVDIARDVSENLFGSVEWSFAVDNPFGLPKRREVAKARRVRSGSRAEKNCRRRASKARSMASGDKRRNNHNRIFRSADYAATQKRFAGDLASACTRFVQMRFGTNAEIAYSSNRQRGAVSRAGLRRWKLCQLMKITSVGPFE
jgi:hypothetical protein